LTSFEMSSGSIGVGASGASGVSGAGGSVAVAPVVRNVPAPVLLKVKAAHDPEWLKRPARQQVECNEFGEN
jgi:hypothetical protein